MDSEHDQIAALASSGVKNFGGVASMYAVSINAGATRSGQDLNALLAEADDTAKPVSPEPLAVSPEPEPSGLSTSQVVTILVVLLLAGAGLYAVVKIGKNRKPPRSGGSGPRKNQQHEPNNKPRITFSS